LHYFIIQKWSTSKVNFNRRERIDTDDWKPIDSKVVKGKGKGTDMPPVLGEKERSAIAVFRIERINQSTAYSITAAELFTPEFLISAIRIDMNESIKDKSTSNP